MSLVILLENSAGGGGGLALVLTSYQYFRSHFLNQCSREKMKNKQTKNKTKILYMKENLQGTHQLRPQGLSLEMWEGSLSWWGKSRRSGRVVDYPAVLFKNLLSYRGLSHDIFCRCAKWVLFGGHFQSLRSDGAGSGNGIAGRSRAVKIFELSDCLRQSSNGHHENTPHAPAHRQMK